MELIRLQKVIHGIAEELVYATARNFSGQAVYPSNAAAFLRPNVAKRVQKAQKILEKRGLALKVYDAYRPFSVQKKFWELVPDPRYIADPAVGSKHNRGAAVDVTLIDEQGKELLMPSEFDDFSIRAHRSFKDLSEEQLQNRAILEDAMERAGFLCDRIYDTEWWHFDDPEWSVYSILDIPFEELL